MVGLGRHYELEITCQGEVRPLEGYLVDIQAVDRAARDTVIPAILHACRETPGAQPAEVLLEAVPLLQRALPATVARVRWRLSPYYSVEAEAGTMSTALIRQRFDFAAAHRLHVASLSAEENRRLFGKCNNPGGHGHNYQFEVCVEVAAGQAGRSLSLQAIEAAAQAVVIDRFDHRNLNDDPAFGTQGLNPSVENIAKVVFDLLKPEVSSAGGRLREVTVWETDRTSCTYPGEG